MKDDESKEKRSRERFSLTQHHAAQTEQSMSFRIWYLENARKKTRGCEDNINRIARKREAERLSRGNSVDTNVPCGLSDHSCMKMKMKFQRTMDDLPLRGQDFHMGRVIRRKNTSLVNQGYCLGGRIHWLEYHHQ